MSDQDGNQKVKVLLKLKKPNANPDRTHPLSNDLIYFALIGRQWAKAVLHNAHSERYDEI